MDTPQTLIDPHTKDEITPKHFGVGIDQILPLVQKVAGKQIVKIIYVPKKMLNIVVK